MSATIVSVDVPPPETELTTSIVGAGAADDSGPDQFDDRPVRVGLLHVERVRPRRGRLGEELEQRVLLRRNMAAGPGDLRDDGVLPGPVDCSARFQPGLGTNESIENPFGRVRTIFVVNAFAFSVGIARL